MSMRHVVLNLLAVCGLVLALSACALSTNAAASVTVTGTGTTLTSGSSADFQKQGGFELVLRAQCPATDTQCAIPAALPQTVTLLQKRLQSGLHVNDGYMTTRQDPTTQAILITVDVPGNNKQSNATVQRYLASPLLEFLDTADTSLMVGTTVTPGSYPVVFTDRDLDHQSIQVSKDDGHPVVDFSMQGSAVTRFANYTEQNIAKYLTIALGGVVIESATIETQIVGQCEISGGNMSSADASSLAAFLRLDSVALDLALVSSQTRKPSGA